MIHRLAAGLLCTLISVAMPDPAAAQRVMGIPLAVEVRAGAGIPTGDFADGRVQAESGVSFGGNVLVGVTPVLGLFAGYSQTRFGCGDCELFQLDRDVRDDGFDVGAQATLRPALVGLEPWLRAGAVFHQLTFSGNGGDASSDRGTGFSVGGGVAYRTTVGFSLTPGVHYRSYTADFPLGDLPGRSVDVAHVIVDLGISYRF